MVVDLAKGKEGHWPQVVDLAKCSAQKGSWSQENLIYLRDLWLLTSLKEKSYSPYQRLDRCTALYCYQGFEQYFY